MIYDDDQICIILLGNIDEKQAKRLVAHVLANVHIDEIHDKTKRRLFAHCPC